MKLSLPLWPVSPGFESVKLRVVRSWTNYSTIGLLFSFGGNIYPDEVFKY
jgi:hypothetical protein